GPARRRRLRPALPRGGAAPAVVMSRTRLLRSTPMRPTVLALTLAGGALAVGLLAPGCGGSSSRGVPPPSLTGVVYDYADEAARGVPVQVLGGGPAGGTQIDGVFVIGPVTAGVLRVGDSTTTPTLLVPFTPVDAATFLDRPVFLPALETGIGANLPSTVGAATTIDGPELPGVSLELLAGTAVSLPPGASTKVRVLGVSPSRLPSALPGDLAPRAAYLVEPHGAAFSPPATLRLPRLDAAAAGPFDAYRVSTTTGAWELVAANVPLVGDEFEVPVAVGTLVAVVPSTAPARVDITGRIVAGTQPVAGFRASCWNVTSAPTDADGRFVLTGVPSSYGTFYLRAYPARPGAEFAPGLSGFTAASATPGDLAVTARAPDKQKPFVRQTSPVDAQQNVSPAVQVVVTFSEPIDRALPEPFRLLGRTGKVDGRLNYDNAFTVRFIPAQPLEVAQRYTILVNDGVTDLSGNRLDDARLAFDFTTLSGAQPPAPTDTIAFGLAPLQVVRGDVVTILGRNFTGGSVVTFGTTAALVQGETSTEVRAVVPDFQPAGDVTVALSAGGVAVGALRPLVVDLRAQVLGLLEGPAPGTPLVVVDRAAPPAQVLVSGANIGNAQVLVDGLPIGAVDSTEVIGGVTVATGRAITLPTPAPATLLTGPVVVRGQNGRPGLTYRFLQVRE
ncbi:MAG: Ig-like domain-containing protein, partial [Planctomycetota bacterium]|nr:Ig-like domain-containing protein [Planctomycetota bacterium]